MIISGLVFIIGFLILTSSLLFSEKEVNLGGSLILGIIIGISTTYWLKGYNIISVKQMTDSCVTNLINFICLDGL